MSTSKVLSTLNAHTIINRSKLKENANSKSLQVENEVMCNFVEYHVHNNSVK